MADAYGSTLDSLMANKIAQQGAQQAEANSYRNFLNQVSNTNLRRREGEALDRRGMEELGISRMNVSGLNDYRRGQVDIGMEDARTRRYEGETGRENVRGLNTYRGGQVDIGKSDAATRLLDTQNMGTYRAGLTQNEANRIASGERLGMRGFDTSERNVGRQVQGMEYAADAGVRSTGIQADANMFDSSNRLKAAQTPYEKLLRAEQLAYDEAGGIEGVQRLRAANSPGSENMRLMQLSNQQEIENQRRSAYGATMDNLTKNFESEAVGWGSWEPNSPRTDEIIRERKRLMQGNRNLNEDEATQEAIAAVSRRVVNSRFGPRPEVDDILREDRYDVPQGSQPQGRGLSAPTAAPTNAAPGRVFNPRGRGIQRPVQQPATGNWPPNE
jgi:hypothetical protein